MRKATTTFATTDLVLLTILSYCNKRQTESTITHIFLNLTFLNFFYSMFHSFLFTNNLKN